MNGLRSLRYWTAIVVAVAVAVAGALWGISERFDWMELWGGEDAAAAPTAETDATGPVTPEPTDPPPALEVVELTVDAASAAAAAGLDAPTLTEGAALGATGPGVCTPSARSAVVQAAVKVTATATDTVAASVSAVGPGLGAHELQRIREAFDDCDGVRVRPASGFGTGDAFTATADGTRSTVLRRGDVIVTVLSVGAANLFSVYGNDPDPVRHDAVVAAADAALTDALTDACVNQMGSPDDASRNPYGDVEFTGLLATRTVTVDELAAGAEPAPGPTDTTPATTAPGSSTTAPVSDPSAQLDDWYAGLPATATLTELAPPPVPRPRWQRYPTEPDPAPDSRSYEVRVADPTGPGCGWAFTATVPPVIDAGELAVAAERAREMNLVALAEERDAAAAAAQEYEEALAEYRSYARDRAAWDRYDDEVRRLTPTTTTTTTVPPSTTTTTTTTTVPPTSTTTTTTTTVPPSTTTPG